MWVPRSGSESRRGRGVYHQPTPRARRAYWLKPWSGSTFGSLDAGRPFHPLRSLPRRRSPSDANVANPVETSASMDSRLRGNDGICGSRCLSIRFSIGRSVAIGVLPFRRASVVPDNRPAPLVTPDTIRGPAFTGRSYSIAGHGAHLMRWTDLAKREPGSSPGCRYARERRSVPAFGRMIDIA